MINNKCIIVILVVSQILLIGCGKKGSNLNSNQMNLSLDELKNWETNNTKDLTREREMDEYKVDLFYMPSNSDGINNFTYVLRLKSKDNKNVYESSISKYADETSKVMYWSSGVRNRLYMMSNKDTVIANAVLFENTGKLRNEIYLNVGFSGNFNESKTYSVVYDDDYLGLGRIEFNVTDLINNSPKLKL